MLLVDQMTWPAGLLGSSNLQKKTHSFQLTDEMLDSQWGSIGFVFVFAVDWSITMWSHYSLMVWRGTVELNLHKCTGIISSPFTPGCILKGKIEQAEDDDGHLYMYWNAVPEQMSYYCHIYKPETEVTIQRSGHTLYSSVLDIGHNEFTHVGFFLIYA